MPYACILDEIVIWNGTALNVQAVVFWNALSWITSTDCLVKFGKILFDRLDGVLEGRTNQYVIVHFNIIEGVCVV